MKFAASILIILSLLIGCKDEKDIYTNVSADLYRTHPSSKIENNKIDGDWFQKVGNIDSIRKDYILKVNEIDGYQNVPDISDKESEMKILIQEIQASLHPSVNNIFQKLVFGIYLSRNLGGSGLTGYVYDKDKPVGGFIIIDTDVMNQSANGWINFKERSVFNFNKTDLVIIIEEEKNDNRLNALRYLLLHELGHIVANTYKFMPDARTEKIDYSKVPFTKEIWINYNKTIYDHYFFKARPKIRFYSDDKMDFDNNWEKIYPVLKSTGLPTLYGAMNPDEYFAESFVSYVHVIVDKRPWILIIWKGEKILFQMENNITSRKDITELFDNLLNSNF